MAEILAERVIIQTSLDPWLDLAGLSQYSSMSRRTLSRRLNSKENPIPHRKSGGKVYVKASWFDRWLEDEHRRAVERPREEIRAMVNTLTDAVNGRGKGRD